MFKKIFKLENADWVYSNGSKFMIEVEVNDDDIRLREPTREECEEILKHLLK